MALMTRKHDLVRQASRESSWLGSDTRSERELSEEPASSYDESFINEGLKEDLPRDSSYDTKRMPLRGPEDDEDVLHPFKNTADRVGREIERFAEALDTFNPQRAHDPRQRQEMMFDLLGHFGNIATETVVRLREKHESERRKKEGRRWRKKMRGFKILQDDEIEMDISDYHDPPSFESHTTLNDLDRWELEAQTWDLLQRLATIRFDTNVKPQKPVHRYSSERDIWDHFLSTEVFALERKTVLKWLKENAEESGEDINVLVEDLQKNAERGDIIAHGWLHTKAAIKDYKRRMSLSEALDPKAPDAESVLLNPSRTEPLSTQLDPDAASRQGRKLAAQDEYFERAIWMGCYELLRRGKSSKEIKEWCMERTENWRAVSMSGFPCDDPVQHGEPADPEAMSRWKRMCFSMARNGGGDDYEQAVYGLLSGDIISVEPVCRSWDDFIFIHYNSLLRNQFDDYLKRHHLKSLVTLPNSNRGNFDAIQFHGETSSAVPRLIENLKANPRTAIESKKPMKMIQGVLLADQFADFIYQQGIALSKIANATGISRVIPPNEEQHQNENLTRYVSMDDHDSLRVLTHILILFMGLGLDLGGVYRETEVQNVIVAYISFLRLAGKEELIPLYCSQLSGKRKYAILSRNLIDIIDEDQRMVQIKLMRELGLDVQEFVSLQARFLLEDFPDLTSGYPASQSFTLFSDNPDSPSSQRTLAKDFIGEEDSVERIDLLLIRSLQWYLLVDGLWAEAFRFGTMLYLRFFKNLHLCAAKMLSINVPSKMLMERKIEVIFCKSRSILDIDPNEDEEPTEALKEHMLAEANNFRELEILIECLDNIDTATCLHNMKKQGLSNQMPPTSFGEWRNSYQVACEEARACARSLMKGWLLTSQDETITPDLKSIREAYLPETLLAYITTLQNAGLSLSRDFLLEAMEVSSILAEEDSDILELFLQTGRLQEMVDNLARASKTLLILSSAKQNQASRGARIKRRGWTLDLWNVKV
ncbi:Nucleoporin [Podosphaera aphanis]|nr:Nucleoporin [Podosphaera aphanis]